MFRTLLNFLACAAGLAVAAGPVAAQMHHEMTDERGACDICAPRLYVSGAALFRSGAALPTATADKTTPLVRARLEAGTAVDHLGVFSQMEFTPADGPTPAIQLGLEVWALKRANAFNLTGGVGIADYRQGIGEQSPGAFVLRGWGQLAAWYHSPVHELTLYAQAGVPFSSVGRPLYQLGVSHPLAPYKLQLP